MSPTANYECWLKQGGRDTAARAAEICAETLAECQQPPTDDAIRAEFGEFVIRRLAEPGELVIGRCAEPGY